MPMMPIWRSTAKRQERRVEAVEVRIGRIHRHQNCVERIALDAFNESVGAVVAGEAEKADDLLLFHFEQRFHRTAFGEDLIHIGHGADVVQLP